MKTNVKRVKKIKINDNVWSTHLALALVGTFPGTEYSAVTMVGPLVKFSSAIGLKALTPLLSLI